MRKCRPVPDDVCSRPSVDTRASVRKGLSYTVGMFSSELLWCTKDFKITTQTVCVMRSIYGVKYGHFWFTFVTVDACCLGSALAIRILKNYKYI